MAEQVFLEQRISTNQTLGSYRSLAEVTTWSNTAQGLYTAGEGRCVGRKANAIGVYEQLAECGQVFDLQNQRLNLVELFENLIYPIWRARGDQGIPNQTIEIFTDSFTASQIQAGMMEYLRYSQPGLARFNIDTQRVMQTAQMGRMGFNYDTYRLQYPIVDIRIVTHPYFDDNASAPSPKASRPLAGSCGFWTSPASIRESSPVTLLLTPPVTLRSLRRSTKTTPA